MSDFSIPDSTRSNVVFHAPFRPSTTTREPRSIARSTSVKISSEPYDFDSSFAINGVLPQAAGVGKVIFATRSEARSSSSDDISFSARFSICWAAVALVALARILFAWSTSCDAFFSAFARSRLRRRSSVSRCVRYAFQPTL